MQNKTSQPFVETKTAVISLAQKAAQAILSIYHSPQSVLQTKKADETPLTLADMAAHRVITKGLQVLTPQISVVSEEDATSMALKSAKELFWLVDPLDGTKEFLARNEEFTVNIALIVEGEPVWGVVVAPALAVTYWGGRSSGAFVDRGQGSMILPEAYPREDGACMRVVVSKSHMNEATQHFVETLGRHELVQAGSSLKFCLLAEGRADLYPRLSPTKEWDTAAAQAILEGAGGEVRMLDGQPLRYGKPNFLNPSFVATAHHCPRDWLP